MSVPVSARLIFRRTTTADLDDLARLLGDPQVTTFYPENLPSRRAAARVGLVVEKERTSATGLVSLV